MTSSKNSQSVISPRGPNCNQAEADALSVYAVKIQCDVSNEESESEEEEELEKSEYSEGETKDRTKLKIQNEGEVIKDIGDLRWKKRQKIKLRHITEPKDGQIQELEALIRTRIVPYVGGAAGEIALNPEGYREDSEENPLG